LAKPPSRRSRSAAARLTIHLSRQGDGYFYQASFDSPSAARFPIRACCSQGIFILVGGKKIVDSNSIINYIHFNRRHVKSILV
jgi:hypothetical protein